MASLYNSLLIFGRGIGQVMFQNNALSGLLMLIGIFLNSWEMGILALGGNIISTLTAYFSGYGRDDIKNGLYGFNGTLVGIAVGVFMELSIGSLLLMAVASCISTWIARLFSFQRSLPGFTAPFILSVWILLEFCTWIVPDMLLVSDAVNDTTQRINYFQTLGFGIGQVMFQGNIWTGLLFLVGVLVNSRAAAFYTVIGVLLPIPLSILLRIDAETLNMGLMGYNGVLCAIALGDRTLKSLVWASCSVLLSVVLQIIGMNLEITTLTAPFVVSVWVIMGIQKLVSSSTVR
ncbi:urea transporter [Bacteroides eggerthii]|jgi:urea transporter|uniref:urea transporter n=1 Tax=Bacteroides eggerthii TaxID=28111 RepID=UPI0020975870|nr:urea transporter [Bacteroides eggerthii]MCO7158873.1 urea transporter [Bacteroides eggerthii]